MTELVNLVARIIYYLILFGGVFLVIYWLYRMWKNRKPALAVTTDCVTLSVEVPRENEKSPLAAEQLFAALHGISRTAEEQKETGIAQEHVSFELVSSEKYLRFFVHTPKILKDFVEGQIYAQYPKVEIKEVEDYTKSIEEDENVHFAATELVFTKEEVYPIKTFLNFDVDPLAAITAVLSKVKHPEQVWVQVLVRPVDDTWQNKGIDYVAKIKSGTTKMPSLLSTLQSGAKKFTGDLLRAAMNPEAAAETAKGETPDATEADLPGPIKAGIEGIETKATKLGFATKIRLVTIANDEVTAKAKLQAAAGTFKQFNTTNLNGFKLSEVKIDDKEALLDFRGRMFDPDDEGFTLNIEELASIYHLPNLSVETPTIVWTGSKKGEPPANLPIVGQVAEEELTPFAQTDFHNNLVTFGIKARDRRHHLYTIGKTGTGKTTLLENMAITDIREGKGVAIVDPHGDFIERVLDFIPPERVNDVVLFDPADSKYPVGFNLLENIDPDMKNVVTSGLIGIFQKIWAFTWGPRLEHILRNTILALIDYPNSTMLGILKMLVDNNFRQRVIEKLSDPIVRDFWEKEFAGYNDKLRSEAVAPIQNKVGQFVSSSTIRNIIGQTKSTIDMQDILDNGKILLINLSKGKIGEDNSALLGAMMITKIQLTAMNRASIPEEQRRDFYLYVDEFQNFATESFGTIFSEARKYHLNIIVANQYITQMPEEVREAVFGNVGTIISFRVGASDSPYLAKEFAPVFEEQDLVNLDTYHIYTKMAIDGVTSPAFSAVTLAPAHEAYGLREQAINSSRSKYGRNIVDVERAIAEWSERESAPVSISRPNNPGSSFTPGGSQSPSTRVRDFNKPEKKTKGPSAVLRLGDKRYEEYIHWDGKKWYQQVKIDDSAPSAGNPPATPKNEPKDFATTSAGDGTPTSQSSNFDLKTAEKTLADPLWQMGLNQETLAPEVVNDQPPIDQNIAGDQKVADDNDVVDITGFEGKNISL